MVAVHQLSDWKVSVIRISDLDIFWNLGFRICNFRFVFKETNDLYLSQTEPTLMLLWLVAGYS